MIRELRQTTLLNGCPTADLNRSPSFLPDGTMIAFVRDNNIFLVKLLYGNSESQVTEDGKQNMVLNGIPRLGI